MRKSNPRIIKYKSDECIIKGDYIQAVWEGLKESGVLFRKCKYKNKYKKRNCPNDFCPYEEKTDRKCGYYE